MEELDPISRRVAAARTRKELEKKKPQRLGAPTEQKQERSFTSRPVVISIPKRHSSHHPTPNTDESREEETTPPGPTQPAKPARKERFFTKYWKAILLATGLATGGYGAAKKANDYYIDTNFGVLDSSPKDREFYMAEAEKVHAENARLEKEKIEKRDAANADFEANRKERERQYAASNLVATDLVAALETAKKAAREAEESRKAVEKIAKEMAARQQIETTEQIPKRPIEPPMPRESKKWQLGTPVNSSNTPDTQATSIALTPAMQEQVEEIYGDNLEKLLPKDTLRHWSKIKNESAKAFIDTDTERIKDPYKNLHLYLKKIHKQSEIAPKIEAGGKPETIENYMTRVLQHAASQGQEKLNNFKH